MRQHWYISIVFLLVLTLSIIILPDNSKSQDSEKGYNIDTAHSAVIFRAKHMGVSYNYGRFNDFSGTITLDETDVSNSLVELEVKTASVDTANAKRDQHLRSPDFFNAKQFPVITFKSTEVKAKPGKENMLEVVGDLQLHGVKKSITVDVELTGSGSSPNAGELIGYETTFALKRSDYGMNFGMQAVSDDIRITVSLEAAHK